MNAKQAVYDVIRGAIANHPRSLQKRIGPSEIGATCDRRIGYKLLGQEENPRGDAWKPTVGTAVHAWLEKALEDANLAQVIAAGGKIEDHELDWITEQSVTVGYLADGTAITGSCDAYHRPTATVIDHKIVGVASLRDKKANGPGQQYRAQVHMYGAGFLMAGHKVQFTQRFRGREIAKTYLALAHGQVAVPQPLELGAHVLGADPRHLVHRPLHHTPR